ncbi:MAG: SAM-dependent methyltransferase [Legionellales bacterium RIFCSPHIGHO2_12_FULL_35_11]|nr:MAG: SAM-dependent methyltransferase [Legionellales bacterium RIFCSPHIGHO2_12_FULL_35_11]
MKYTHLTDDLYKYISKISVREHPVMTKLRLETQKMTLAEMQIPPEQAQFMQFLIKLIGAKRVLEVGTFTGYSALAMALALPEDGKLITCDISEEWTKSNQVYWSEAGQAEKINLRLGQAINTLDELLLHEGKGSFDFIFIDADKTNYVYYYQKAKELLSNNGVIAIDNVLWSGQIIDMSDTRGQTREIRKLNEIIQNDNSVDISLLTIADGLFLIRKK